MRALSAFWRKAGVKQKVDGGGGKETRTVRY